jgi:hypothetical protein
MEHVVFFPAHDGSPAFRRVASLEDAVRFVEHIRNTEGVDRVSVHALTEVPLSFKAYYRVEMPAETGVPTPAPAAPVAEQPPVEQPLVEGGPEAVAEAAVEAPEAEQVAPAVVPEQETPAEVGPQPSSLGFFAR